MTLPGGWLLPIVWFACGATVVVSALLAGRSLTAYRTGIWATAFLWVNAGAAVNLAFLLTDQSYDGFADGSWSGFVTETWESLAVPHQTLFLGLLIDRDRPELLPLDVEEAQLRAAERADRREVAGFEAVVLREGGQPGDDLVAGLEDDGIGLAAVAVEKS